MAIVANMPKVPLRIPGKTCSSTGTALHQVSFSGRTAGFPHQHPIPALSPLQAAALENACSRWPGRSTFVATRYVRRFLQPRRERSRYFQSDRTVHQSTPHRPAIRMRVRARTRAGEDGPSASSRWTKQYQDIASSHARHPAYGTSGRSIPSVRRHSVRSATVADASHNAQP